MSEDYKNGFKDGFAAGLEEGKKLNDKSYTDGYMEGLRKTMPPPYNPNPSWPSYWPTYVTCDDTNALRGAVGSEVGYTYAAGANGPVGTMSMNGPSITEEKNRLDRNNQVYINGQWAELGN